MWWDYGDVDAFFLNPGHSHSWRDTSGSSPILVTVEHLERALELHRLLDGFTSLDLGIARWRRSKRATTVEDRLVELRIALESVLLPDDNGVVGEKRHRLAIRGAWLLGQTLEQRKSYFRSLRDAYDYASSVLHAGRLKEEGRGSAGQSHYRSSGRLSGRDTTDSSGQGDAGLDRHHLGHGVSSSARKFCGIERGCSPTPHGY